MKKFLIVLFLPILFCACEKLSSLIETTPSANVIMIEGPLFEDGYSLFSYTGRVKNTGNADADFIKIYIYVRKSDNSLLSTEWTYADDYDLAPNETSFFEVMFWDSDHAIRNQMDKSKTTYEIKWD